MEPIIEVDNLSKRYLINTRQKYITLRESIMSGLNLPLDLLRKKSPTLGNERRGFWALQGVSFKVMPGEILGIIGANGAGKSTILKILSRITYPTSGRVILRGRVASLLEVGTGFHQELTGRENIFLNGAVLGMRRAEIKRKFDEIVYFSGVEKFIDTPVKHYSSGMYVRLAFAVAANLDADILLIDEVLSVGDAEFQRKSLGKMEKITKEGRTVIFVSHSMDTVQRLCNRAILFDKGRVVNDSCDVVGVTALHLERSKALPAGTKRPSPKERAGNGVVRFSSVFFADLNGQKIDEVVELTPFKLLLTMTCQKAVEVDSLAVTFTDQYGRDILATYIRDSLTDLHLKKGKNALAVSINPNPLVPGVFSLELYCSGVNGEIYDVVRNAYMFRVNPKHGEITYAGRTGVIHMSLLWQKL